MWKNYFKTPFRDGCGIYIFDSDGHPVCNFMQDFDKDFCERIVGTINGNCVSVGTHEYTLSEDKIYIYMDGTPILLMRGWGYLTGVGGCHLKPKKAIKVQDSLVEYICKQLNKKIL